MTEELKIKLSNKKVRNIPTKDWFANDIEIGDIIIIPNCGIYDVGKVVSLSESGITITCYRVTTTYAGTTKQSTRVSYPSITQSHFWPANANISHVKELLSKHNGTLYKRLYISNENVNGVRVFPSVINLSKLTHYESIEN